MSKLNEFGLEDKYLVIKREDMIELLENSSLNAAQMRVAITKINNSRRDKGKKENEYIVVNADEPYAKQVAALIKGHGDKHVEMVECDGHYYPLDYCTTTNPMTSGGKSVVDDVDLPCGFDCEGNCDSCAIQNIFDQYAKLTGQSN